DCPSIKPAGHGLRRSCNPSARTPTTRSTMRSSRPKYLETSLSGKATDHEARCMASILESRRAESDRRLTALRKSLSKATKREEGRACVYLTGSFARGEASPHSDLDLF